MNKWKLIWDKIRSNTAFVAFEGGASGAAMNYIYDGLTSGHLDFSRVGLGKLAAFTVLGGITAVRLLYRPSPSPTVPATTPPSTQIQDVPAKLEPLDPKAVPVEPPK
jgi:hypothetical protein